MASNSYVNGIVNVVKPPHMTSHDVVNHIRRSHNQSKVGHTGTLDPMACGLMTICLGKATKISEYMLSEDKVYRAEITFGISTDTQDIWGKILEESDSFPTKDEFLKALEPFRGKILQKPPMFSAVKHKGKKLYELAREGITVERKLREIEIKSLELISFEKTKAMIDVHCSKGTYIRTLCNDIGENLGCGAVMSFLLRIKSGPFHLNDAVPYDHENLLEKTIEIDKALYALREIHVDDSSYMQLFNGNTIIVPLKHEEGDSYKVYSGDKFVGIGKVFSIDQKDKTECVKIDKLLV
ncbi:MAG: tRNA pseudouridine(55) synthase TruB [Peptostreptococcaceae bacterium]|nr:tRNA pseudouridine(55) synthase TruB [Peptostreptococcaceae bacterium]